MGQIISFIREKIYPTKDYCLYCSDTIEKGDVCKCVYSYINLTEHTDDYN